MLKNILIGVTALLVIGVLAGGNKSNDAVTDPPLNNAKLANAAPSYALKLNGFNCTKAYGFITTEGTVTNISDEPIKSLMVIVSHYQSSSKTFIKSAEAMVEFQPLMPGQKSPFKAITSDNPMITACVPSFKTMFGGQIPTKA